MSVSQLGWLLRLPLFCMVSIHAEPTFERLRYLFGGDRPSQTAHPNNVPEPDPWLLVRISALQEWISPTATPQVLASLFLRLPPILYMKYRNPILGYSKAPWGLSVLSRVTGIFTGTTISPGVLLRQCPDRYAIRAGQNLPDKEFRYLRTVYSYGRRLLGASIRGSHSSS